jgi:hypothetical protein
MQVDLQDLTPDEQDLCASIADGKQVSLSDKVRIDAQVLRHIVLGLPFKKDKGVFKALIRALRGSTDEIDRCSRTPVGISIEGGTIHGRLDIASAIGDGGGPICPLEFSKTTFENGPNGAGVGFSGANAHFSRLSFKNCAFADEDNDPDTKGEIRTICLSGAKLNAPLDMSGIHPKSAGGLLWVAAAGIRVKGGIDLSACRLRAPGPWRVPDTAARDALDLTLAEIAGDLHLLKSSRMTGRLKMRGARIHGDLWLNGANIRSRGAEESLFLQGTTIVGFLVMRRDSRASFRCDGNIDLTAVEVGRSLIFQRAEVGGGIKAPDLTIRDDFFLHASIRGKVDLEHMTIGGSLDLSHLRVRGLKTPFFPKDSKASLSLKDSNIGRELRLARIKADGGPPFRLDGTADLTGLSCDTLDDDIGRSWGRNAVIRMNHFTYRRAGWLSDRTGDSSRSRSKKPSYRIVSDWIRSRHADGRLPWRWFPRKLLSKDEDFWDPWQLRRNWIYQHYESEETRAASVNSFVSIARHKIREHEYRPQPFEQAIRVARAEGREDFAAHFDMHKQRLEWRFFNRGVRWPLGFVAIVLSSLWLCSHANSSWSLWLTLLALAATLGLMVSGSWIRDWICSPLVRFVQKTRHAWLLGAVVEIVLLALWLSHSGGTAWIFAFLAVSVGAIAYVILGTEAAIALSKGTGGRRAPPGKDAERVRAVSSKVLT